jgi:transcriptional regulator with XRE-family HTH domain
MPPRVVYKSFPVCNNLAIKSSYRNSFYAVAKKIKPPTGEAMEIGEKLARQRKTLGLEVEDVSASTGMSVRQVLAIEAGAEQFASPAEMNRMIRLYARKLGVLVDTDTFGVAPRRLDPEVVTPPPIPRFLLKPEAGRAD